MTRELIARARKWLEQEMRLAACKLCRSSLSRIKEKIFNNAAVLQTHNESMLGWGLAWRRVAQISLHAVQAHTNVSAPHNIP